MNRPLPARSLTHSPTIPGSGTRYISEDGTDTGTMSTFEREVQATGTVDRNTTKIAGISVGLVALNVVLMFALSFTPVAELGLLAFSNFILGIVVFGATVGGGFWLASAGIEKGSMPQAGAGVAVTQFGYSLLGSALLSFLAAGSTRVLALGITAVATGVVTALVTVVVFSTDHSFERWQTYSWVCFGGGIVLGIVGVFTTSLLIVGASVLFFLGFVVDLTYEIWALKENRYASDLRNAIGIYVAVMGVFIHILQLVIRLLGLLSE